MADTPKFVNSPLPGCDMQNATQERYKIQEDIKSRYPEYATLQNLGAPNEVAEAKLPQEERKRIEDARQKVSESIAHCAR